MVFHSSIRCRRCWWPLSSLSNEPVKTTRKLLSAPSDRLKWRAWAPLVPPFTVDGLRHPVKSQRGELRNKQLCWKPPCLGVFFMKLGNCTPRKKLGKKIRARFKTRLDCTIITYHHQTSPLEVQGTHSKSAYSKSPKISQWYTPSVCPSQRRPKDWTSAGFSATHVAMILQLFTWKSLWRCKSESFWLFGLKDFHQ